MTPADRRKLAEAVAERLGGYVLDGWASPGCSDHEIGGTGVALQTRRNGEWTVVAAGDACWIAPFVPVSGRCLTGRNWLPRTADAIAEAVRAAGGAT